jgi:hypothetical protein
VVLAQQVASVSDVVAKLAAERHNHQVRDDSGDPSGTTAAHPCRNAPPPSNRSAIGRNKPDKEVQFNCSTLPKLLFPKFTGDNPRIWIDKCVNHFTIFHIPQWLWTTAASLHMEENSTNWLQVYKMQHVLADWNTFVAAVERKFGAFDYRKAIQELLYVKQEGSVEDYTRDFAAIQYQVSIFNAGFNEIFFTSHFINGLKEEIKVVVQPQLPDTVDKAALLARIQ